MKKLTESLAVKIAAIILSFFVAALLAASVAAALFMADSGYYTEKTEDIRKTLITDREILPAAHSLVNAYASDIDMKTYAGERGFYFTMYDCVTGELIASNYSGEEYMFTGTAENVDIYEYVYNDDYGYEIAVEIGDADITVYIPEAAVSGFTMFLLDASDFLYSIRYSVFVIGAASAVLWAALLCYLCAAAGHRSGGEIKTNHLDRIPFDVLTAAVVILAFLSAALIGQTVYTSSFVGAAVIVAAVLTTDYFIALGYVLSIATRVKTRTLIKNNVIYKAVRFILKYVGKFFGWLKYTFKNIPLVGKTAAVCCAAAAFQLIVYSLFSFYPGTLLFLWFCFTAAIITVVIFIAVALQKIKQGGERIAGGDLEYKIDTKYMYGDFKEFCDDLNNINKGVSVAVSEKMKSERFKTELITNVSHDIKTPLTSIINYVDLIKKENPENENIKNYIEVLDRQSGRLKKLIEDLVEASKASTGSLAVNLAESDVSVLLSQTVGEFDERLKAAGLTAVLGLPEKPVLIMADGRHLWRVFDNLMNNICKYSQKGTRVYLDVAESSGTVTVIFKNISAYELNISGEELTERFVRGDRSRNTEGSGLGLSIARSLTELQNGTLDIDIDGDLFKVTLTFNSIQKGS